MGHATSGDDPMNDAAKGDRAALVRLAQRGDARALAELAERAGTAVYAVALAHLGRPADAEDVAQTALLAALSGIESCREPERFDAWLFAIARNRARRALLRRRLRDVLAFSPPEPADPSGPADSLDRRALLRALASLPSRPREVVLLHDLEGYTHGEIARALSITEEASRQHLSRARKQLRALLEEKK
jgi:RNA polymerase sigma-70 factor, ECF subfamily